MRRSLAAVAALGVLGLASPASAEWLRGETRHFVVYAESEGVVREYANMLEDFDATLRLAHGRKVDEPAARRLDVYVVRSDVDLKRVFPDAALHVVGYYSAGEDDIAAVAIKGAAKGENDVNFGDDTVLHEYVHHFLMQYYPSSYPGWLSEGYAEYYATADLDSKVVRVGGVNRGRAAQLVNGAWLPMREVLSKQARVFIDQGGGQAGAYYAEAWLLTHYLMSDTGRRAQLNQYLKAVAGGRDALAAWTEVFGDTPEQLDGKLKAYVRSRIMGTSYEHTWGQPEVKITRLSPAASEVLLEALRSRLNADEQPQALLADLRQADAKGDDDFVRLARARMEVRVGDRAEGQAILRKLIDKNPANAEAQFVLARSLMAGAAADPAAREAAYKEAGRLLAQALKTDPDNYQALAAYAQTRTVEPNFPTENTYNIMLKAVSLAPQYRGLRIRAAQLAIMRKDTEMARNLLTPVANDPHAGPASAQAQRMLERLGQPQRAQAN